MTAQITEGRKIDVLNEAKVLLPIVVGALAVILGPFTLLGGAVESVADRRVGWIQRRR